MGKVLFVDISRCINCRACEVACGRECGGRSQIWVTQVNGRYAVPLNCRQCETAPCAVVCPTKALVWDEEGALVLDAPKCNGCRLCAMQCPFNVIHYDPVKKVIGKCDLCQHRRMEGKPLACVITCPTRALIYDEFDAIVAQLRERVAESIVKGTALKLGFLLNKP